MATIKQRRIKVGTSYYASGYGRGINTRNVYLIDGFFYVYHPDYAKTQYTPLEGELTGYIPVNKTAQRVGNGYVVNEYFTACKPNRTPDYERDNFHQPAI
jgi:hypothetical protein